MAEKRYKLEGPGVLERARKIGDELYGSEIHARPGGPRTGYTGTFEQGYKNLGQGPNAPEAIVYNGTKALTDAFIERVYEKTGQFPSAEQTRDFVSGNLTTGFAEKIIQGSISADSIKTQMVDPFMGANAGEFTPESTAVDEGIESRLMGLKDRLRGFYEGQRGALKERV